MERVKLYVDNARQCDQIIRLLVQYLAVYESVKKLSNNLTKECSQVCHIQNKPSKNCPILLKFCQSFVIFGKSGHTAARIGTAV